MQTLKQLRQQSNYIYKRITQKGKDFINDEDNQNYLITRFEDYIISQILEDKPEIPIDNLVSLVNQMFKTYLKVNNDETNKAFTQAINYVTYPIFKEFVSEQLKDAGYKIQYFKSQDDQIILE